MNILYKNIIFTLTLSMCASSWAADKSLSFSGTLVDSPSCDLQDISPVDFNTVETKKLIAGVYSKSITIVLKNCNAQTNKAKLSLGGAANTNGYLELDANSAADGFHLKFTDPDNSDALVEVGGSAENYTIQPSQDNTLNLDVMLVADDPNDVAKLTAGSFTATATVTVDFE